MTSRCVAATLVLAVMAGTAHGAERLDSLFDSLQIDFGRVQHGSLQTHKFVLKNTTRNDVVIRSVGVSCTCTSATVDSYVVKPGESTNVVAAMNTSRFYGSKSVTVYVTFSAPYSTTVSLRVSASSESSVPVTMMEVDLGNVPQGEKTVKKFTIDHKNPKWKITRIIDLGAGVKGTVKELSRDANLVRYELTISLPENLHEGPFAEQIKIQSSDTSIPEVIVVAKANVEPTISISPNQVQLRDVTPGQKISKNFVLNSKTPFSVLRAEDSSVPVVIRTAQEKKKTQVVTVTFTIPNDLSKVAGQLKLVTDLETAKPIVIPIQR